MDAIFEVFFELLLNLIAFVIEPFLGDLASADTIAARIFWGIVLVVLGVVIWWAIR